MPVELTDAVGEMALVADALSPGAVDVPDVLPDCK
jgi:hypothetical protein